MSKLGDELQQLRKGKCSHFATSEVPSRRGEGQGTWG